MPFVGAWYVWFLGNAGVEAEYTPDRHFAHVVHWIAYFVVRAVGALAEWTFADCKVLVWRSFDQAADWAV